jgi:hypothetical protein
VLNLIQLCSSCLPVANRLQGQMLPEGGQAEAMATIFVWLRYSSSRQLTWQRNYNTQPRILGEAQSRLTHAVAEVNHQITCCVRIKIADIY